MAAIGKIDTVLNFARQDEALDDDIEGMIQSRTEAKKNRDFALADKIRDDLQAMGISLEDTPEGVRWKRKV